jgi:ethanolamine utilization protein EutQ (cupin superfamily)
MSDAAPVAPLTVADYQEGAIVSRTLLKRGGGTVTLFDAIVHVLEGEALVTIAGSPIAVRSGEMVLMPANQPHAVYATSRFKMLLSMIRSA